MSSWIESMYSCSSLIGLVSSKRRWQRPPNSSAIPKLSAIDLGWPMWRYPFGSGGKRVTTSATLPSRTSAATISRMKSLRSGAAGPSALTGPLLIPKRLVQPPAFPGQPAGLAIVGQLVEHGLHPLEHGGCGEKLVAAERL